MTEPIKTCNRCHEPKLLSEFGVNSYYATRGARDGRQAICKGCINTAMTKRRESEAWRKQQKLKPKPTPKEKPKIDPEVEVMKAVNAGYLTFNRIQLYTGLDEDRISNALAVLAFEDKALRVDRNKPEARFYPRAKAA